MPTQARHQVEVYDLSSYCTGELADLFGVSRSTIYRTTSAGRRRCRRGDRKRVALLEHDRELRHIEKNRAVITVGTRASLASLQPGTAHR